jgi:hypothetical protein
MSNWKDHAYFDLGIRVQVDENTTYHGQAWHTESGTLHCCIGPETSFVVESDGECKVYHGGRQAW